MCQSFLVVARAYERLDLYTEEAVRTLLKPEVLTLGRWSRRNQEFGYATRSSSGLWLRWKLVISWRLGAELKTFKDKMWP